MELAVCHSSSLREVLGPTHKETRYGFDGIKNRPLSRPGRELTSLAKHESVWTGRAHTVHVGDYLGNGPSCGLKEIRLACRSYQPSGSLGICLVDSWKSAKVSTSQ